ncbi:MAG TPA: chlorophyllide reductase subunit Y, partial [Reyranella sp.]|nr:chlorophyllide reductase subunit Y [Reyranella sp.]
MSMQPMTAAGTLADTARVLPILDAAPGAPEAAASGCHAGAATLTAAANAAGKSETLERYAADYPMGPHDRPQSMCPAFGSLR